MTPTAPADPDPLRVAQDGALETLSRLLLWVWTPLFVGVALTQWPLLVRQPAVLASWCMVPLAGWLLRAAPSRPAATRAAAAAWAIVVATLLAIAMNGPRAVNVAGLGVVLTLLLLFHGRRLTLAVLLLHAVVATASALARTAGWIEPAIDDASRPLFYQLAVTVMTMSALGYCAAVSLATIRVYGVARDVAQQRLRDLLEAQGEAELLQRREVQATAATGMAHDIANIVQVMTGTVDLLREQQLDAAGLQAVRDIEVVGEKATTTLRTLLAVGRGLAPDPTAPQDERTDVRALLSRLEVLLRPLLGRAIALTVESNTARVVRADQARIEQVLLNLALNARDAMKGGGALRIASSDADGGVAIDVADTGTGIAPDVQARMFEPYFTTKAKGKGTGLGLAMVQRIVAQCGGRISVTSTPGAGATFTVWLPSAPVSR